MATSQMHDVCKCLIQHLETGAAPTNLFTDARSDWDCREAIIAQVRDCSISRISVYCTGDWNAQQQAAHAAQVRLIEP